MLTTDAIHTISRAGDGYPFLLDQCDDAPKMLYCAGNVSLLAHPHALAIVGTRTPTTYGLSAAESLVEACVTADIMTISGMAFGIDARVHEHTIARGGKTIAVLGSSVDEASLVPRAHVQLARRIIQSGGLLVSEYAPGTVTHKGSFPARNRIIAGLSQATCVVEARERSGSLITAYRALEYNRTVCAVPGSIFSTQSQGTHALIAKGAVPWISNATLCELFPHLEQLKINNTDTATVSSATNKCISLGAEYDEILDLCSVANSFDTIVAHTGRNASTLQHQLATLLLQSALSLNNHGLYITTRSIPGSGQTTSSHD